MDDKHRDILRRHWPSLRKNLEIVELLPQLGDVLGQADQEKVQAEATRREKIDKLLDIIPRKGPEAFDNFLKALQKIQPFLAVPLLQESEKEEMKTELNRARTHSAKLREEVVQLGRGLEKEQQKHKKDAERTRRIDEKPSAWIRYGKWRG
ncbi:hypothetical protein OS493_037701 [Desmophyllum pertusum]|uniref:CARD domain-containing protein n=1 Tax=Desmophyllum pertusum TaxID=174260 RepID=A0A9W9Y8L4_9CNID|nr:hypothetical protein OS493_037701 [Desmophyllum pertusum]